jgi:rod shape-determining protein MreC
MIPRRTPAKASSGRRFILLVVASLVLLTLPRSVVSRAQELTFQLLSPVDRAVAATLRPFVSFADGIANAGRLRQENERLREELKQLRAEGEQGLASQAKIEALERMLQLHQSSPHRGVVARVVVPRESNLDSTVLIDVGSADGIVEGFPVVDPDGLVGIVEKVSPTSSRVRLIVDPLFGAGARLAKSRDVGVVVGNGSQELELRLIDPRVATEVGELVVTSGAAGGSRLPSDIPIGRVKSTGASAGELEARIVVEPAVNLSRLEYVRVLIYGSEGVDTAVQSFRK